MAKRLAEEPELVMIPCFLPCKALNSASKAATSSPMVQLPDARTRSMAAASSSPQLEKAVGKVYLVIRRASYIPPARCCR